MRSKVLGLVAVAVLAVLATAAALVMLLADRGQTAATAATTPPSTTPVTTTLPATTVPATTVPPIPADCTLSAKLAEGDVAPDVACLETHLIAEGVLYGITPDETFDATTKEAVKAFQKLNGLVVDGTIGPQTANSLGAWVGPDVQPPDPATCTSPGHEAVVDRFNQRAWLCDAGTITAAFPITSAWTQPDPGTYAVYEKNLDAASSLSGRVSTMTQFVAFTYGKYQGARIAFHSVPTYADDGQFVQPLESVGSPDMQGDSSGCIRVLPTDAVMIWDWLQIGDQVTVVS